jgi:DNA-directed RNA polymerase alpha subunit
MLKHQLAKFVDVLDITEWQRAKLKEAGINTVGDVLLSSETKLQTLSYVGEKRSRRIKNAALAAVFEYLSG